MDDSKKWTNDPSVLVDAFPKASGRIKALLDDDKYSRAPGSIWGRVCKILFKQNRRLRRLWLYIIWTKNRYGVQDIYLDSLRPYEKMAQKRDKLGGDDSFLKSKPFATSTPLRDVSIVAQEMVVYCYCQMTELVADLSYVFCSSCKTWMHCICNNTKLKILKDKASWTCLKCQKIGFQEPSILRNINWTNTKILSPDMVQSDIDENQKTQSEDSPPIYKDASTEDAYSGNAESGREPDLSEYDIYSASDDCEYEYDRVQDSETEENENESSNIDKPKLGTDEESRCSSDVKESNRTSSNEDSSAEDGLYVVETPPSFRFQISADQWEKLKPIVVDGPMNANWVNYFNRHFEKESTRYCVLAAKGHKSHDPSKHPRANYIYARGYCTLPPCEAKFVFTSSKKSKDGEELNVHVSVKGRIVHKRSDINVKFRRLNLEDRDAAKEKLKHLDPSAYRNKLFREADLDALRLGNFNKPKSLKVMQKAKSEVKHVEDLSRNPYSDLVRTKESFEKGSKDGRNGYIRDLGSHPIRVVMYHEESFKVLDELRAYYKTIGKDVCLEVHATGFHFKRFPAPWDTEQQLYYCICVSHPVKCEPPYPLCEVVTTDQTPTAMKLMYNKFFSQYAEKRRGLGDAYGVRHVEVDFSKALIAARDTRRPSPQAPPIGNPPRP